MGGNATIQFVSDEGEASARITSRLAVAEAERIERKFSRYLEGSVTSVIQRAAGTMPVAVDEETVFLVTRSLQLAEETAGAFDPTSGVLRRAWNFRSGEVPGPARIDALLPFVDYRQVGLRDGTVFLRKAGMELDFGGVGKEYAVDRVTRVLRDRGARCGLVNLAGDLRTFGSRDDGRPWHIGVTDPRTRRDCLFSVNFLGGAGVASSGTYERFFEKDGVRYHHLLDARTGWPARGVAATTVVSGSAFEAGLAATASFLLGPDEGLAWLQRRPEIEGALLLDSGEIRATPGMQMLTDLPGAFYALHPP
jgi:thiamine biosynthesis lipoprotein